MRRRQEKRIQKKFCEYFITNFFALFTITTVFFVMILVSGAHASVSTIDADPENFVSGLVKGAMTTALVDEMRPESMHALVQTFSWEKKIALGFGITTSFSGFLLIGYYVVRRRQHKKSSLVHDNHHYIHFHHWLVKVYVPKRFQPQHIIDHPHQPLSHTQYIDLVFFHHHFFHIRKAFAFLFSLNVLFTLSGAYTLVTTPHAAAAGGIFKGDAFATFSNGTGNMNFSLRTINDTSTATNRSSWELDASGSITLYYKQWTSGTLPPSAPNKVELKVYYETGTAMTVKTFVALGAAVPANGTSYTFYGTSDGNNGSAPRAGTLRLFVHSVKDDGPGGVGNYDVDSDTLAEGDMGAIRVNMKVSDIAKNIYPNSSTHYAYGTAGNESMIFTATTTDRYADRNVEMIRILSRRNSNDGVIDTGSTVEVGTSGSTVQTFVADSTYDASLTIYDTEVEIIGNSLLLTGETWTRMADSGHGGSITRKSNTASEYPALFQADPTISFSGVTFGESVYNRGESSTHSFNVLNSRSEPLTRTVTWTVRDVSNTTVTTGSGTGATYNKAYVIGVSDTADSTLTGNQWNIITTLGDVQNISTSIFRVSSLLSIDTIWHAKFTSDTSETSQFFIGADNMQVKTHVKNVRGENKTGATVTCAVLDPDLTSVDSCGGTTVSTGYTGFTKVVPSAPAGAYTIRSTATDANSNSTTTDYDESITYISSYAGNYGLRTIGWNQEYHKGDTASFAIQTLELNDSDDWVTKDADTGTTPTYEIKYWDGSVWQAVVAKTNMTVSIANHTWTASFVIPNADTQIGRKYSVSFVTRLGGAQVTQLKEFSVVQQTAGDPITVVASPSRATDSDTVRITIRESNLNATARSGNASGTKVYIYDPNNTALINGSVPTGLGNGVYYYNYALGSAPTHGIWQVVVTTDSDVYSAATNFEVNESLASQSSVDTANGTINAVKLTGEDTNTRVVTIASDVATVKTNLATLQGDVTEISNTLSDVSSRLKKLSGTLPDGYDGVYDQLSEIIKSLNDADVMKNSTIKNLYTLSQENHDDIKYLKNKIFDVSALVETMKSLVATSGKKPAVTTWYTYNSVVVNFLITNPTNAKQSIPFKAYLPREAKQEHILSLGGMVLAFDEAAQTNTVSGEVELAPGESSTQSVELQDIWEIKREDMDALRNQAQYFSDSLEKTSYQAQAALLKNDVVSRLDTVWKDQETAKKTPSEHILAYRSNMEEMDIVEEDIQTLKSLLVTSGAQSGLVASLGGIGAIATWGIIVVLVSGLAFLGILFYSLWRHQMEALNALVTPHTQTLSSRLSSAGLPVISSIPQYRPSSRGIPIEASRDSIATVVSPHIPNVKTNDKTHTLAIIGIGIALVLSTGGVLWWGLSSKNAMRDELSATEPVSNSESDMIQTKDMPSGLSEETLFKVKALTHNTMMVSAKETGWVNMRSAPTITATIVMKVPDGSSLEELEWKEDEKGRKWMRTTVNGETGWIVSEYIR